MKSVRTLVVAATGAAALAAYGQRAGGALMVPPADKDVLIGRSRGNEGEVRFIVRETILAPQCCRGPFGPRKCQVAVDAGRSHGSGGTSRYASAPRTPAGDGERERPVFGRWWAKFGSSPPTFKIESPENRLRKLAVYRAAVGRDATRKGSASRGG